MHAKVLLLAALIAVIKAAPAEKNQVPIVAQETNIDPDGKYHYHYETGDGSKASQDGELRLINNEPGAVSHGGFQFVAADDGKTYSVEYTADENGYQPKGDHIPTIPPLIQKALAYLATAPPPREK